MVVFRREADRLSWRLASVAPQTLPGTASRNVLSKPVRVGCIPLRPYRSPFSLAWLPFRGRFVRSGMQATIGVSQGFAAPYPLGFASRVVSP